MIKKKTKKLKRVRAKVNPRAKTAKRRSKIKRGTPKGRKGKNMPQDAGLEKIGEVTHYFPKAKAAAVLILKNSLKVGDDIYIKGHTTDFKQKVASMELDRVAIHEGKKSQEIGLLVKSRVRVGDTVYKIMPRPESSGMPILRKVMNLVKGKA